MSPNTAYDMRAGDALGWASLTCIGSNPVSSPTPDVDILTFGTRPAERQESVPVEIVKLRVDQNPHHEVRADLTDNPGGERLDDGRVQRPYTATHDLPFLSHARP